jgi:hypothetical protein
MSWLRLFADAGCLTEEQQKKAQTTVYDYTMALQKSLAAAGYFPGPPTGYSDPRRSTR